MVEFRNSPATVPGQLGRLEKEAGSASSTEPDAPGAEKSEILAQINAPGQKGKKKKKGKKKWFALGGASMGVLALGIFLFLFASSLLIPNLTQNILELEFTRLSRQFTYALTPVVNEALAVQSTSDQVIKGGTKSLRQVVVDYYVDQPGIVNGLKGLALDKVIGNLKLSDDLKFEYSRTKFGNRIISAVFLDGEKFAVPPQQGALRKFFTPDFLQFLDREHIAAQADFASRFIPAMEKALGARGSGAIGTAIRGNVIADIMQRIFKISPGVWTAGDLINFAKAKTPEQASFQLENDSYRTVSAAGTDPQKTALAEEIDEGARAATEDVEQHLAAETEAAQEQAAADIQSGKMTQSAGDAATRAMDGGLLKNLLRVGDPLLTASMTACIIFEGSLEQSGQTVDVTMEHQIRTLTYLAGIASEQESGGPKIVAAPGKESPASVGLRVGLGAMRTKLADITKSNAYIQINGGTVDTTQTSLSAQATPFQTYTLLSVLFHDNKDMADATNGVAEAICPLMTHPVTAVVLTAVNVGLIIASLGSGAPPEALFESGVEAGAAKVSGNIATRIVGNIATRLADQGLAGTVKRVGAFLFKNGAIVGGTIGATELAKLIVYANSGLTYSGLEQGADFINSAQAGANGYTNERLRTQMFSPPTTYAETAKNDSLDKKQVAAINASQSFTDRYFAASNPDSLLMRAATMTYSGVYQFKNDPGTAIASLLMAPIHLAGTLANVFSGVSFADESPGTQHYGNVQFGWTPEEQALINSSNSYLPLENEKILDDSGLRERIAEKYAVCFGYTYDPSGTTWEPAVDGSKLVPAIGIGGEASIGTLLSKGYIVRQENGDLATDRPYLCSPQNLGIHNPEFGDKVFRFRISERYYTTIGQLQNLQTVTKQ